tara:strand:+ start:67 stop:306 length:240 start_codon:yes stop_codon:yes gene_type:complete
MTRSKQHQEKSLRMKRIERLSQEVGVDAAKLELEIEQLPAINASRLVNLHGRLSAGTYKISLEKTSRKLLSFEQKLDSI